MRLHKLSEPATDDVAVWMVILMVCVGLGAVAVGNKTPASQPVYYSNCRGLTNKRVIYDGQRGFTGAYLGNNQVRFHPGGADDPQEVNSFVVNCAGLTPTISTREGY